MRKILPAALFSVSMLVSPLAIAAEKTIKLSVPGMSCASCPYMVKDSISMVDGVMTVTATMEDRSATVVYDDAITNLDEITRATANIGYPSTLFNSGGDS